MSRNLNPRVTEGTEQKSVVTDDNTRQLLSDILKELKIMNMHLAIISSEEIGKEEIE